LRGGAAQDGLLEAQRRHEVAQVLLARWMSHGPQDAWLD